MRVIVLLLMAANIVYFGWSQGYLRSIGFAPVVQSEAERVTQQVKPESVRVLSDSEFKRVEELAKADLTPRECLQAGPLTEAQNLALRPLLEKTLPEGSWTVQPVRIPGRWVVYMGKFATPQLMEKKRAELAALNVRAEMVSLPVLQPGLSLGGFETKDRASEELVRLAPRGVNSARVIEERAESAGFQLKLPVVNDAVKAHLQDVKAALGGVGLKQCD